VVLCGGTTKIPRVQDQIRNLLPKAEFMGSSLSSDEIIAIGAATQAQLSAKYEIEWPTGLSLDVKVTETPVTFKVCTWNRILPV